MSNKFFIVALIIFLGNSASGIAQQTDAEGCKNTPYFKRLPNSFITECEIDTDEMEFIIAPDSIVRKEGLKTFIAYGYNPLKARIAPSFSQIVKIYEDEVIKKGGRKMYYSNDAGNATLFFKLNDKEIWVVIDDGSGDGEGYYSISILETKKAPQ